MTEVVRARIDHALKEQATAVLEALGLSTSDAIRMLFTCIAKEKGLPAGLTKPNALTVEAIMESRALMQAKTFPFETSEGLFDALEGKRKKNRNKASPSI